MKVPPHIDELMWQIAEADDTSAYAEFEARYPEFIAEMSKRAELVRGLKGSRPAKAVRKRERFMPSRRVQPTPVPAWALGIDAVAAMAGVAFATYGVAKFVESRNPQQPTIIVQQPPQNPPQNVNLPTNSNQTPKPETNPTTPLPPEEPLKPFDTPVTVIANQTTLQEALYSVATQAGVTIELAPNFPDLDISIDYRGVKAIDVLNDMGRNFGFTPFVQTDTSALLIPALENKPPGFEPKPLTGGSNLAPDDENAGREPVLELPR